MVLSHLSSATAFKVWSALAIWILGIAGGLLPLFVQDVSPRIRSVLTMFAGGIFFAGAILHLLPDAVDNEALAHLGASSTAVDDDVESSSSLWAFFFFAIGFLMILFLEVFALEIQRYILQKQQQQQQQQHYHHHHQQSTTSPASTRSDSSSSSSSAMIDDNEENYRLMEDPATVAVSSTTHNHDISGMANLHNLPPIVSMIVFLALSCHSIMEGVAIGSNPNSAWDIFFAIAAHKAFAAFALGLELLSNSVSTKRLIGSMLLFSLMTPLGIALGWWVTNVVASKASSSNDDEASDETVASGICTALSAGTFLYVAVMELIPHEFQNPQDQGFKCLALFLGFVSFGTLAIWVYCDTSLWRILVSTSII